MTYYRLQTETVKCTGINFFPEYQGEAYLGNVRLTLFRTLGHVK